MLDILFSNEYNVDEKKKDLENEFGIPMTETISKEVAEMCNYSVYVEKRGEIKTLFDLVMDGTITMQIGASKLKISVESFAKALENYKATGEVSLSVN